MQAPRWRFVVEVFRAVESMGLSGLHVPALIRFVWQKKTYVNYLSPRDNGVMDSWRAGFDPSVVQKFSLWCKVIEMELSCDRSSYRS